MRASLTVLIPCFQAAAFLGDALDSVLAQRRRPDELLVIDDASSDGSAGVAAAYTERAAALGITLRVLRQAENSGEARARNDGLRVAQGELVAMLDADDWWEPNHLSAVVPILEQHPDVVAAGSGARFVGGRSGEWVPHIPDGGPVPAFDIAFRRTPFCHSSVVARRRAVVAAGGYEVTPGPRGTVYEHWPRLASDFSLWLRLAHAGPLAASHEITVAYRWHGGQLSNRLYEQRGSLYVSRWSFITALRDREAAVLDERMLEIWTSELQEAWESRDVSQLRMLLRVRPLVRGASAWRALPYRVGLRARPLWDALPLALRRQLKGGGDDDEPGAFRPLG